MTSWSEYVWNGLIWNKWIYNKSSHIQINDQNSFYINTFYHFILINSLLKSQTVLRIMYLSNMVTWRWLYSMFPHAKPYIHINTRNYLHVHHSANGMYLWTHFITKCHDTFHAFSSYLCTPTLHHKHTHTLQRITQEHAWKTNLSYKDTRQIGIIFTYFSDSSVNKTDMREKVHW